MTGFTLGTENGATLGTENGGTLGVADERYLLDGRPLPAYTFERATDTRLTLGFRVTTDALLDACRQAKTDEDKIDVLRDDRGGFTALDRAGGTNSFELTPPPSRQPLRQPGTYHVSRYEEDLVSQSVDEWQVEIEFARDDDRTDSAEITPQEQEGAIVGGDAGGTLGESTGFTLGGPNGATLGNTRPGVPADYWGIDTRNGQLVTDRVDAAFLGTGVDGVERFELTARLTFAQSLAFETALARLGGVRVRQIPDGRNLAVDDTNGSDATVTIDSPTPAVVANGEYVVMAWESERLNDAFQQYEIEIAKT